jgi:hypothetical protein
MNAADKRARMLAARCAIERIERAKDENWLATMRAEPGSEAWVRLEQKRRGLDLALARKARELRELQGRAWLEVVT